MTKIFAHRGFSGLYPENSMLAFQKAAEMGADGIELDVHLSRDGQVVVAHDENMKRVSGRDVRIADLTADELSKIEILGGELGARGQTVPTLKGYFEMIRATGLLTNIELKNSILPYAGLEEKVLALIDAFGLRDRILFSSFNHHSMAKMKVLAPWARCACLVGARLERAGEYAKARGFSHVNPLYLTLDDEAIAEIHAEGVGIQAWTVDDPNAVKYLIQKGIYAVITNRPDMAMKVHAEVLAS